MARRVIDELVMLLGFEFSPQTKREIQRIDRSLAVFKSNVQKAMQRAGLAINDFSDDVSEAGRESRADLERVGRATDALGRDVADMAAKVERETEQAERSFDEMADKANQSGKKVAGAFAGIAAGFGVKSVAEFRVELARIDNQLTGLNFKQVESGVLGVSSAVGVHKDIVTELARQIPNELARTPEEFVTTLEKRIKQVKLRGPDVDPIELSNLFNIADLRLPPEARDRFNEQFNKLISENPVLRDSFDEISEGLGVALSGKDTLAEKERAIAQLFGLLAAAGAKAGRDVINAAAPDLSRDIQGVMEETGATYQQALVKILSGSVEGLAAASDDYLKIIRADGDALALINKSTAEFTGDIQGVNPQLQNLAKASGGLKSALIRVQNFLTGFASGLVDLLGAFGAILPAVAGGALALQAFGLDLSGVGRALRGFARFLAHPIASLQRFIAWLKASRLALLLQRGALGALRVAANLLSIAWWRQNVPLAILWLQLKRLTIQSWLANAGQLAFRAGMLIGAVATGIATAATWALNTAMLANPIGLIIAAIAGLVVGFTFLVLKVDAVRNVFVAVWDWIKGNWPVLASILLGPFGVVAAVVWKFRDQIMGFLMGIFNWLKATPIFGPLIDWAQDAIGWVKTLFGWIGKIGEAFGWVKGAIGFGGPDDTSPAGQTARTVMDGFAAGADALPTAPPAASAVANSVNRSVTVEVGEITINAPGADSREIAARVREQIREELRDLVVSMDSAVAR